MRVVWMFLLSAVLTVTSYASEGLLDLGSEKNVKEATIAALQQTIARHESLSRDEIAADLAVSASRLNQALSARGTGIEIDPSLLTSLDRDELIALERAALQEAMSSTNYMFAATQSALHELKSNRDSNAYFNSLRCIALMLAIPLDIALLPFTFLGSAVTGF